MVWSFPLTFIFFKMVKTTKQIVHEFLSLLSNSIGKPFKPKSRYMLIIVDHVIVYGTILWTLADWLPPFAQNRVVKNMFGPEMAQKSLVSKEALFKRNGTLSHLCQAELPRNFHILQTSSQCIVDIIDTQPLIYGLIHYIYIYRYMDIIITKKTNGNIHKKHRYSQIITLPMESNGLRPIWM